MRPLQRIALTLLPFVLGAASGGLPSSPAELPSYQAAYEPTGVDERGQWMEADESERRLRDSTLLMHDEKLNVYMRTVLCRAVGEDRCRGVRVYLVEVPMFNASMAPNGTLRVWTGLLLRVHNEAELAAVLAHEFAHYELRHGLRTFQRSRTNGDVGAWLTVLAGFSNTNVANAQLLLIGDVYHFSREQETEADLYSLKYLAKSPYAVSVVPGIWEHAMAEDDATRVGRGLKPRRDYSAGFFDTHPTSAARAALLRAIVAKLPSTGELGAERYHNAMRPLMPRLLAAQVKSNDFGGSQYILNGLAEGEGWSGDLLFSRAELYRQRANPRDLTTAAELYRQAIAQGYTDPVAKRELGLALLRNGQSSDGQAALREYLSLMPEASDKTVIRSLAGN